MAAALRDVHEGLPLPAAQLTVDKYLADWLEQTARPKLKPATCRSYEELVRLHIAPALGHHRLVKLQPAHVRAFFNDKSAAGASPRRIQMMRDVLRAALNHALKWELVYRNVATMADPPRVPLAEIQPLTPEGATRFLEAARGNRYEHLFALLLTTGLRLGEAFGLLAGAVTSTLSSSERSPCDIRSSGCRIDPGPWPNRRHVPRTEPFR